MWWHQGGNMPDFVPDWLRITTPVTSQKLAALSHGEKLETIEELKGQGLVWETLDGQRVRILSRKRGSKVVEVQDIGSSDSYWTYVDALGK
jgi:hypothetical protein